MAGSRQATANRLERDGDSASAHSTLAAGQSQGRADAVKKKLKELDDLLDEAIDQGLDASSWYDRVIKAMINLKLAAIGEFGPSIFDHTFAGWYDAFEALDLALDEAVAANDGFNFEKVRAALKKAREAKRKIEGWIAEAVKAGKKVPDSIPKRLKEMDDLLDEAIDNGLDASSWYDRVIRAVIRLKYGVLSDFDVWLFGHSFIGWILNFEELDRIFAQAMKTNDGFNFEGVREVLKRARELKKKLESWVADYKPSEPQEYFRAPRAPDEFRGKSNWSVVPGNLLLPKGAAYATAVVVPETKIEARQPGFAVVVTGEVVEARRVEPGDKLSASETPAIVFDDGTGLLVQPKPPSPIVPLLITCGVALLSDGKGSDGLPVFNGSSTVCIGGTKPFESAAIVGKDGKVDPADQVSSLLLDPDGKVVGQSCTFNDLNVGNLSGAKIRTLDSNGKVVQEVELDGGPIDGSLRASLDRRVYTTGQNGTVTIGNQDGYARMLNACRFGGSVDLAGSPISIFGVQNAKGIPNQVPFGTKQIKFTTERPGTISIGLMMPGSVPPSPSAPPKGATLATVEAYDNFAFWKKCFGSAPPRKVSMQIISPMLSSSLVGNPLVDRPSKHPISRKRLFAGTVGSA